MFRRLFWKEWRENLWKLGFGSAVSATFIIALFRIRLFPDYSNAYMISLVQMLALPVIYALDIFSGEMSNRTIHLLFKVPAERWKIFFSKYIVSITGMGLIFLFSGLLMEALAHGREAYPGYLLKVNLSFGASALLLFTWFCPFGAQNRSEAASLAAMAGVLIGWAIIFFWSSICQVGWAAHFVPYNFTIYLIPEKSVEIHLAVLILLSGFSAVGALAVACLRFVKVRRYL